MRSRYDEIYLSLDGLTAFAVAEATTMGKMRDERDTAFVKRIVATYLLMAEIGKTSRPLEQPGSATAGQGVTDAPAGARVEESPGALPLREYTAFRYSAPTGSCKCGKCQLVPHAVVAFYAEQIDRLKATLKKIKNESYTDADLQIRDCDRPEMIWQSVARRALAATTALSSEDRG